MWRHGWKKNGNASVAEQPGRIQGQFVVQKLERCGKAPVVIREQRRREFPELPVAGLCHPPVTMAGLRRPTASMCLITTTRLRKAAAVSLIAALPGLASRLLIQPAVETSASDQMGLVLGVQQHYFSAIH